MAQVRNNEENISYSLRTGDVGYFDEKGRLWYCGRKKECVHVQNKIIAPLKVESVFNFHERIYQTAYVGASKNGKIIPTLVPP